ncbi:hypothetical protein Tco_1285675 [Tanacetum coccineum]
MSTLTFADTHNMVAFLEKPAESDGFHEIIDFLNANQIRYALTLQALIDKKKVIITETSIRSDLQLEDAGVCTQDLDQQVPPEAMQLIAACVKGQKEVAVHMLGQVRGSKKLKPGALSLYVGDGHRAAIEAIGTYHLELPKWISYCLKNLSLSPIYY